MSPGDVASPDRVAGALWLLSTLAVVLLFLAVAFAFLAMSVRLRSDARKHRWRRLEEAWQAPVLEVVDGSAPPESLHALVAPEDALFFVGYVLRYDRRLGGDERARLRAAVRPYLARIVAEVRSRKPERRARAVQTLARMGLPEHADVVAGALDDPSPLVAMIAAQGLFQPGYADYFQGVVDHLDRFAAWNRGYLTGVLAGGGAGATPLLRGLLRDERRPAVIRAVAADTLHALNSLDAVEDAAEILEGAPGTDLAVACLRLLGHAGYGRHAELARRYVGAENHAVRAAALEALGTVGGPADAALLEEHLGDASAWTALAAARALLEVAGAGPLREAAAGEGRASEVARQVASEGGA